MNWRFRSLALSIAAISLATACGRAPTALDSAVGSSTTAEACPDATANPGGRLGPAIAFDSSRGQLVLFGGNRLVGPSLEPSADTWIRNGSCWSSVGGGGSPPARSDAAIAHDETARATVLYGGAQSFPGKAPVNLFDTWLWDGERWISAQVDSSPALISPIGAYDPAAGGFILYGLSQSTSSPETWKWNGGRWLQLQLAATPPARLDGAMAYDARTRKLVLFGGFNAAIGTLDDTWTFDGADWTQQSPSNRPTPRIGAALCTSSSLILFGGSSVSGPVSSETWLWTGSDWRKVGAPHAPPARRGASCVATDAGPLLIGGQTDNGAFASDAWRFRSMDWERSQ